MSSGRIAEFVGAGLGVVGIGMFVVAQIAAPPRRMSHVEQGIGPAPSWAGPLLLAAIVVTLVGVIVFAVGLSRARRKPPAGTADISAEIAAHPLPFGVCSHCRLLIDLPHAFACPRCGSAATTMQVETDAERKTALASLAN